MLHKRNVYAKMCLIRKINRKPARVRAAVRELRAAVDQGGFFYATDRKRKGSFLRSNSKEEITGDIGKK